MTRALRLRLRSADGFGLVELMIALTVLLIGALGIFAMFESGLRSVQRAGERTTAAALASSQMERLRAVTWESIGLDETAVLTAPAPYSSDSAHRPPTGRVAVPACGVVTPCTSAVPVRTVTGADGRDYRVDTYVTWQAVAAGRDVKVVSVVVRDPDAPARTITRIASAFDGEVPGTDVPVVPVVTPNTPPVVLSPGDQSTQRGRAVTVPVVATDVDLDVVTFSAVGLPDGLSIDISSGVISGTVTTAGGYSPRIDVYDGEATTSVTFAWAVTAPAPPVNLARGRAAIQSSTASGRVASRAVDGDLRGTNSTRTQTSNSSRPFWEVDLGTISAIGRIRIIGGDGCCGSSAPSLVVLGSDLPFISGNLTTDMALADFSRTIASPDYADTSFTATGSVRYVRLYLNGTGSLRLAEVEVYSE